jgi:hypothetical protein
METYNELESLGFFKWLSETHNLVDTDMESEYLDKLPLNDIHRTVCNSMALRWFREKYKYVSEINVWSNTDGYSYSFKILTGNYIKFIDSYDCWSTYEEAESACIDELIKIIKNKTDEKDNNTDNNSRLHL